MRQLAIDIGGTFTDCVVLEESGTFQKFKTSTTPSDPTEGFFAAIRKAADTEGLAVEAFLAGVERIVHGTTIGTNVLLTGRGAKVGMITTEGFREVIEMRRGIKNLRGSMFDQFIEPYRPLVPRYLRLGVRERILYTGAVLEPLDEEAVRRAAAELVRQGCESIAVCFLHSYANPAHELRARDIIAEVAPDAHVVASHRILPVWREFERFSSTVVSACIGPAIQGYIDSLTQQLRELHFEGALLMMLASGLVQWVDECRDRAVYLLGSGPAAAPSGALHFGRLHGREHLLSVDMGGTSFDVCLVRDGDVPTTTDAWIGEERVAIRMVDVNSVGAGGGSIAWVDALGLLRVGPVSAGADPGPAAYGLGDEPTVTDADLVLGYVPADYFLGGEISLDVTRSRAALERVGQEVGLSVEEAALAVFATVNVQMGDAITESCTKRGFDVRDFVMVAGGGAGGVHAAAIAQRLSIPMVIVPRVSALLSAFGMLTMALGQQYARTRFTDLGRTDAPAFQALYDEMEAEAAESFARMGVSRSDVTLTRSVDMRYVGQFHELEIELPPGPVTDGVLAELTARFHARYDKLFGYQLPWQPVEFLTFSLRVMVPPSPLDLVPATEAGELEAARRPERQCLFPSGARVVPVYEGTNLRSGHRIEGPALIDDPTTTVLVLEGFTCDVDRHGTFVLRADDSDDAAIAASAAGERSW
jgi:N-methylhydantoinase A